MSDTEKTALERLTEYLKRMKIAPGRLEKMAGLANGYLRNNKGSISSTKLLDILTVLPDLNGDWLLTGRGEASIEKERTVVHQGEHAKGSAFATSGTAILVTTGKDEDQDEKEVEVSELLEEDEDPTDLQSMKKAVFKYKNIIEQLREKIIEMKKEYDELDEELRDVYRTNHQLQKENRRLRGEN